MKNILILNSGVTNKGSRALIVSTTSTIKKYVPDSNFILMGYEINQSKIPIKKQIALNPLKNIAPWTYLLYCTYIHTCKRVGINMPISEKSRLYDYYNADVVINSGGDHLSGEKSKFGLSSFMNILYAKLLDKPVVLYGESLGYYTNPMFNYIAKNIINQTDLIILREEISKKYLETNNICNPKVFVTADPAFLLDPISQTEVYKILNKEGINEIQEPLIGINPSGFISHFRKNGSDQDETEIIDIFVQTIDHVIETMNATVILIPHVYTKNVDDRKTISHIYEKVKNKSKTNVIRSEYEPDELKGVIGMCDLFIGARMHATIASTSMLVPTIGIAYSHKMYGIIGQMLGQDKYIININELNYDILSAKIKDIWTNRKKVKNELETKVPIIKQKALLSGEYVKGLLDTS